MQEVELISREEYRQQVIKEFTDLSPEYAGLTEDDPVIRILIAVADSNYNKMLATVNLPSFLLKAENKFIKSVKFN